MKQLLSQKLSPQQIQFIKLLQIPTAELETRIKEELEVNPALEEGDENEDEQEHDDDSDDSDDDFDDPDSEFDNDDNTLDEDFDDRSEEQPEIELPKDDSRRTRLTIRIWTLATTSTTTKLPATKCRATAPAKPRTTAKCPWPTPAATLIDSLFDQLGFADSR